MSTPNVYPVVVTWDGNTQKAKASCEAEYLEILDEMPDNCRIGDDYNVWTKRELESWNNESEFGDRLAIEFLECLQMMSRHEMIEHEIAADEWNMRKAGDYYEN
jgi:hypothetical protein